MIIKNLNSSISGFSLHNISFDTQPGQILSFIGRSGSGKTTLLRCLAGLEKYTVDFEDKPKAVGFVFQGSNLFPHLNLEQNIQLALQKVQKKSSAEIQEITDDVLSRVKLTHRKNHFPHQLSGGEQQRGAIARALALKSEVIFYDEPTSALDPELVDEIYDIMLDLKKTNITQIVVSHDRRTLKKISDQVGYIDQGKLIMLCSFEYILNHIKELNNEQQKFVELFT